MTSNGQSDVFITKLDSNGNFIWAKSLGGVSYDTVFRVTIDTLGNIYTSGCMNNFGDYDPGPSIYMMGNGTKQIFISKLDLNGNFVWARTFEKTTDAFNNINRTSLNIDNAGNVYVLGNYHDTVDFDPGPNVFNMDGTSQGSLFLLKLNSTGNFVWSRNFQNQTFGAEMLGLDIASDSFGNVVIAGASEEILLIDTFANITVGCVFLVKYDSLGNVIWDQHIGCQFPSCNPYASLSFDKYNNVFFAIANDHHLSFPNNIVLNASYIYGNFDLVLAKYNSNGSFSWAKMLYTGANTQAVSNSIEFDNENNLIIAGQFKDKRDFDLGPNTHFLGFLDPNGSNYFEFICKIDTAANYKWAYSSIDSFNDNSIKSLAIDKSGKIYVVGKIYYGNFVKFHDDPCATTNIVLDSINNLFCNTSGQGYLSMITTGGISPYSYQWNTGQTTSAISFTNPGIYSVIVHDSVGCFDSVSLLMNTANYPLGFDLNSNFVNVGSLTTWTNSPIGLDVFNDGCIPQTGTVKMVLDSLLTYYSAYPTPSQIIGDTVVWNYSNLNYNSPHFQPHVTVNPLGNMGDTVCVTTIIDPITGDANPANNAKTNCYVITGSFDPNDISVYPQGVCDSGYVLPNTTFTYTIDFQNVGNDTAKKIYILDTLDTDLDINTVSVIGKSHNMYTEVLTGNVLKFHFDNINLTYINNNDSASRGHVLFQVNYLNATSIGSTIKNKAAIYFDNNPPIFTNEVINTLVVDLPDCYNNISAPQTICINTIPAIIIGNIPIGGNSLYNYTWLKSTSSSSSGFSAAFGVNNGSNYQPTALNTTTWYKRVVTNSYSIDTSTAIEIKVNPLPTVTLNQDSIDIWCEGDTVGILANTNSVVPAYQWQQNGENIQGATNNFYKANTTGYYTVTVRALGCSTQSAPMFDSFITTPIVTIVQSGNSLSAIKGFYNYQWNLDGSPIAGASNQIYSPVQNGNYTLKGTLPSGCSGISNVLFFTFSSAGHLFSVSPNPFNESFTIICPSAKGTIMVFDATGKEVVSLSLSKPKTIIDMKGYSSEVYFVKYGDGNETETVKVVKE